MKTLFCLLALIPFAGFAQTGQGVRYTDPNASINKTDIPRTVNGNNSTNSTAGDWIDNKKVTVPTTATSQPVQTNEAKGSNKRPGQGGNSTPTEASASDKRPTVKDKSVKSKDVPGSKKKK